MKKCFFLLFFLFMAGAGAGSDSLTIQTTNFSFEFTEPDAGTAKFLAGHAEEARREIVFIMGFDFKAQTTVRLAPDASSYRHFSGKKTLPEWSVGAAFPKDNLIVLLSPRGSKRRIEALPVFRHELCHVFLGRALAGREAPRWLDEGIAKFKSEPWGREKTFRMTVAAITGNSIPLSRLVNAWPADEKNAATAYLESQAFVDYLFRQAAVSTVVESLANGETVSDALSKATGFALPDLDREFDRFLRKNYTWANLLLQQDLFWGFAAVLFIVAAIVTFIRSRKKLRLMEIEDELEDLGESYRPARRFRNKPSAPTRIKGGNGEDG